MMQLTNRAVNKKFWIWCQPHAFKKVWTITKKLFKMTQTLGKKYLEGNLSTNYDDSQPVLTWLGVKMSLREAKSPKVKTGKGSPLCDRLHEKTVQQCHSHVSHLFFYSALVVSCVIKDFSFLNVSYMYSLIIRFACLWST